MQLNSLDHIAIIASDYPRSLAFYQALGFTLISEVHRPQDIMSFLQCGDIVLQLFGKPDAPMRVSGPEACGLRHLAFVVPDLDEAVSQLAGKGIPAQPIRPNRFTFIKDPDGLPIELRENRAHSIAY